MAGIEIADYNREVPVSAELGDDLLKQPALVLFDRQEQVGALLGGELKNAGEVCSASAWINTPSSSSVLSKALGLPWFRGQVDRSHAMTLRLSIDDQPDQDKAPVHGAAKAGGRRALPQ